MAKRLVVVQRLRSVDPKLKQKSRSQMWYSQIVVHILETASLVQSRMLNVLTVQKYTLGGSSDADVAMEDSIRDVNTVTQEIKVMQDMLRAIPPGELEDEKFQH